MNQDNEAGGFLQRMFGKGHDASPPEAKADVASPGSLKLEDIQGFILRGYRMPMVRHFLLQVGVAAEARKMLGRLVSSNESDAPQVTTARDWHVGFAAGPADDASELPRCKPDYCLNFGVTWAGMLALELRELLPTLAFKSFGAFVEGRRQACGAGGRCRLGRPAELDGRLRLWR